MTENSYRLEPIGVIRSSLAERENAPRQGDEGAPEAWVELDARVARGLVGLRVGDEVLVLTWLHLAERDVLQVRPRGLIDRPLAGVFTTRSPDRPNPIGLHRVAILEIDEHRLRVGPIEAIDGTPVIDIKPLLRSIEER